MGKIWSLKMNEAKLIKALSLFDSFSDKDDDLVLSLTNYFKAFGMSRSLWDKVEKQAGCPDRNISKGRVYEYKRRNKRRRPTGRHTKRQTRGHFKYAEKKGRYFFYFGSHSFIGKRN